MTLSPAAQRVLRSVAATLVPDGAADLGDQIARKIASLPRPADRAELDRLQRPNQLLLVTLHQMASCRMGANARTSVVDAEHRVWGIRGLYVTDASVVPSASGVNPMLTVMAIAHRAAGIIASHQPSAVSRQR